MKTRIYLGIDKNSGFTEIWNENHKNKIKYSGIEFFFSPAEIWPPSGRDEV